MLVIADPLATSPDLFGFVATCACDCGCAARVPADRVMCTWCANGHKSG